MAVNQLEYLKANPFARIREDKVPDSDVRYVSPAEFRRLIDAAQVLDDEPQRLWWQAFVALCYTAGLRLNEILNLTWSDIDFEQDMIRVVAKPAIGMLQDWQPKGKKLRKIPIPKFTLGSSVREFIHFETHDR